MRACVVRGGCHTWGGELKRSQVHTLELPFLGLVAENITSKDRFLLPSHGRDQEEALRSKVKVESRTPTAGAHSFGAVCPGASCLISLCIIFLLFIYLTESLRIQ